MKIILKIQYKTIFNRIRQISFFGKVIALLIAVILILNNFGLLKFISGLFQSSTTTNNYLMKWQVAFFLISVINVASVIFLGGSNLLVKKLIYFPFSFKKILLFEVTAITFNIFNLPFVFFYLASYFIFNTIYEISSFLTLLFITLLFVISLNCFIYFFEIAIIWLRNKKLLVLLLVATFILIFFSFIEINFIKDFDIQGLYKLIIWSPAGRLSRIIFLNEISFWEILQSSFYFLFLISLLFWINLIVAKKVIHTRNLSDGRKHGSKKNKVHKILLFFKFKPFCNREILYHLRSIKILVLFFIIIIGYTLLIAFLMKDAVINPKETLFKLKMAGAFFNIILILIFSGNIFRFDKTEANILFTLPMSISEIVKMKMMITYMFGAVNLLFISIGLMWLGVNLNNYLLFLALIIFLLLLLQFPAVSLSFYFPKNLDPNAVNGLNVSLISLIIFIPIIALSYMLSKCILEISDNSNKLIAIFFLLLFSYIILKFNLFQKLSTMLSVKKYKLIKKLK